MANEELARRFDIKLWIGGHDATDYINPYLKELTYTDSADGEADDLQFTLHDRDGHWCNDWQPTKGTKVKCTAVCKNWEEPGKDIKLLCGEFTIDEVEFSGPPTQVRIKALTSAMTTGLRDSRKSRAWQNSSFQNVAGQIAEEHNLELQYDGDPCSFERKDQRSDSDLGFLNRQCRENGFNFKVHDGKLVIRDARKAEMQEPVLTIPMKGMMYSPTSWSFKTSSADTGYTEAKSVYTDPKKGKTHTAVVEAERSGDQYDEADKSITLDGRTESPADAARKAKAKLQDKNGKENTCSIDMMGCPSLYAGQVISLTGYGTFSGNYLIKKLTHKFSSSGYTTSAELSKCRSKEDKVVVAKSVEVTSRAGVEKKQEENKFKNSGLSLSNAKTRYDKAVYSLMKRKGEQISDEDRMIFCLPAIAEAMRDSEKDLNDRQGWEYLAVLLRHWICREARIHESKLEDESAFDPIWIDWDWVMNFDRAKNEYKRFACCINSKNDSELNKTVFSSIALEKLTERLLKDNKFTDNKEYFNYIDSEWQYWEKNYYTYRAIPGYEPSVTHPVDGLLIALEGCTLRALASGWVTPGAPLPNGKRKYSIYVEKIAVFVHDVFNFDSSWKDWFGLGYWSCILRNFAPVVDLTDGFGEDAPDGRPYYIQMKADYFRSFRERWKRGGDFLVLSGPHLVEDFRGKKYDTEI